ncbi:MAG: phytoene/squalene synthase family protein [Verrucomicrobiota bacterium]
MNRTPDALLKATSRSFYLTLRVLPAAVRPQISLAYLLARTTDTIADTEIIPLAQRLTALQHLQARILGDTATPINFAVLAGQQTQSGEKILLEETESSLACLGTLSTADLQRVRDVLATITSGQVLDLQRFSGAASGKTVALQTTAELDDYTYRVAGCVGEFWTRICRAHLFPEAPIDEPQFLADGIRFGKGLQLVNILRDLPADLQNGRCYLPLEKLAAASLSPENLLASAHEPQFLQLFRAHLDLADSYLAAGWRYTNTLPFGQIRIRLACAWPILLGGRTLEKLRSADVAALQRRVKVSRGEVRGIIFRSLMACGWPSAWRKLYPHL